MTAENFEKLLRLLAPIVEELGEQQNAKATINVDLLEEIAVRVTADQEQRRGSQENFSPNLVRTAASYVYWVNKLYSVSFVSLANDQDSLNLRYDTQFVALQLGLAVAALTLDDSHIKTEIAPNLFKEAIYALRYKDLSQEAIYWMLVALLENQTG